MNAKDYADLAAMANAQGKILQPDGNGGYTLIDPPETPEEAVVVRYSKLAIIRALKGVNLWASVKAAIVEADAWDEWEAAAWIAGDDALYTSMSATLSAAHPEIDLAAILANCLY